MLSQQGSKVICVWVCADLATCISDPVLSGVKSAEHSLLTGNDITFESSAVNQLFFSVSLLRGQQETQGMWTQNIIFRTKWLLKAGANFKWDLPLNSALLELFKCSEVIFWYIKPSFPSLPLLFLSLTYPHSSDFFITAWLLYLEYPVCLENFPLGVASLMQKYDFSSHNQYKTFAIHKKNLCIKVHLICPSEFKLYEV